MLPDQSDESKLHSLAQASGTILYKAKSVWPFTFFPHTIIIDQNKVDVIYGIFFYSKSLFTILLSDIKTVRVSTGLFFAQLDFEIQGYEQNPEPVSYLRKKDAVEIRQIIMGLATAKRDGVNIESVETNKLINEVQNIGQTQENIISKI